jgi:hypothetical protein
MKQEPPPRAVTPTATPSDCVLREWEENGRAGTHVRMIEGESVGNCWCGEVHQPGEAKDVHLTTAVVCPSCDGRGGGQAFVCGPNVGGMRWMPCSFCEGAGRVAPGRAGFYGRGRELSAARLAKGYTTREIAKLYGVSLGRWSDLEHGRVSETREVEDALAWLAKQPAAVRARTD